jgi:hypothetical protein
MTRLNPATKGNSRQVATLQGSTPDHAGSAAIKSPGFTDQQLDELFHLMIQTINHAFDERSKTNTSTFTTGQTGTSILPPADFTPGQIDILSQIVSLAVHDSFDERNEMTAPYPAAGTGFTDQQLEEICDLMSLTLNDAFDDRAKAGFSHQQIEALSQIMYPIVKGAFEEHEHNQWEKGFTGTQLDEITLVVKNTIDEAFEERANTKFYEDKIYIDETWFSCKQLDQISHMVTMTVNQAVDRAFEQRFGSTHGASPDFMEVDARHAVNFVDRVSNFIHRPNPLDTQPSPEQNNNSETSTKSAQQNTATNTNIATNTIRGTFEETLTGKLGKFMIATTPLILTKLCL